MNRRWLSPWAALVALALSGCLPESSPRPSSEPFQVEGLDVDTLPSVPRNHEIQVVFNDDVDPTSFDDLSVQLFSGPDFDESVPLALDFSGRAALLRSWLPTGLRPDTDYLLKLSGFPNLHAPRRSRDDQVLDAPWHATFRTGDDFVPERGAPYVLTDLRKDRLTSLGELSLRFNEVVRPSVRTPDPAKLRDHAGRDVPGRFEWDIVAGTTEISFVPEYERTGLETYELILSPDLVDLAGNALMGERRFTYLVDPGARRDTLSFDLAHPFHAYRGEGMILAGDGKTVRARPGGFSGNAMVGSGDALSDRRLGGLGIDPAVEFAELDQPLFGTRPVRAQILFEPGDVGPAGDIHRLYFETVSRPDRDTVFDHVEIRLWQTDATELSDSFLDNRPGDRTRRDSTRGMHVEHLGHLIVPAQGPHDFFTVDLSSPFSWDGKRSLVVEVLHFGGTDRIESAGAFRPEGRAVRSIGAPGRTLADDLEPIADDIRFGIAREDRVIVWDRFEDLGSDEAVVGTGELSGNVPYVDDFVLVEYEATPKASGGRALDATSPATVHPADLAGLRHLRFRIWILRAEIDGEPIELERLTLPVSGR